MSSWRDRQARKDERERITGRGTDVVCGFLAYPIALVVLGLAGYVLSVKRLPSVSGSPSTQGGKLMAGLLLLAAGAGLMVGFGWPEKKHRRWVWALQTFFFIAAPLLGAWITH